jgi:hypothetical protein
MAALIEQADVLRLPLTPLHLHILSLLSASPISFSLHCPPSDVRPLPLSISFAASSRQPRTLFRRLSSCAMRVSTLALPLLAACASSAYTLPSNQFVRISSRHLCTVETLR